VAANWRLDLATVLVKTAAEVSAYPEATPLRSRPVLVKGSGAAVYLVDDALPEPDAGTPAPDARAAGPDAAALAADASQPPGAPDGSIPSHDGSIAAGADATSGPGATDVNSGCGCAASGSGSLPLFAAVLAFWAVVARRRRVAG
jgi:MYXO-CTERM domain-containing protein